MIRVLRWIAPAVALALVLGFAPSAKAEGETGSVKVTVQDKDGNAVAEANVSLVKAVARPARPAQGDAKPLADGDQPNPPARPERPARPEPVAKGVTAADGTVKLDNVPVGDYQVVANKRGAGAGRATVKIEAGATAEVTIKLQAMQPRNPAGGNAAPR